VVVVIGLAGVARAASAADTCSTAAASPPSIRMARPPAPPQASTRRATSSGSTPSARLPGASLLRRDSSILGVLANGFGTPSYRRPRRVSATSCAGELASAQWRRRLHR
jgi:hypothetical protein